MTDEALTTEQLRRKIWEIIADVSVGGKGAPNSSEATSAILALIASAQGKDAAVKSHIDSVCPECGSLGKCDHSASISKTEVTAATMDPERAVLDEDVDELCDNILNFTWSSVDMVTARVLAHAVKRHRNALSLLQQTTREVTKDEIVALLMTRPKPLTEGKLADKFLAQYIILPRPVVSLVEGK